MSEIDGVRAEKRLRELAKGVQTFEDAEDE